MSCLKAFQLPLFPTVVHVLLHEEDFKFSVMVIAIATTKKECSSAWLLSCGHDIVHLLQKLITTAMY